MLTIAEAQLPYDADQAQTRRCSRCGGVKPIDDFPMKSKATGRRGVWCRDCRRAYGRDHYRRNKPAYMKRARRRTNVDRSRARDVVAEYLRANPCVDCGESDILLLDFDHRERSSKRAPVARLVSTGLISVVMAEIAKCDVRCGNCHRKRTAAQFNWRKSPQFQDSRRAVAPLGRAEVLRDRYTGHRTVVDLGRRYQPAVLAMSWGEGPSRIRVRRPHDRITPKLLPGVSRRRAPRALPDEQGDLHRMGHPADAAEARRTCGARPRLPASSSMRRLR